MIFFQEMVGGGSAAQIKSRLNSDKHHGEETTNKNEAKITHTKNFVPFKSFSRYPPDPFISEIVSNININTDQIRSSTKLKLLLANIIQNCSINSHQQNDQFVKVRLDTIMKLLVTQLCIPPLMTFFGIGVSLNRGSNGSFESGGSLENEVGDIIIDALSLLKYSESFTKQNSKCLIFSQRYFSS